jgi:hypothetical protein
MDQRSGLPVIQLIANPPGPRLRYVAEVIFTYILKLPYEWVNLPETVQSVENPCIFYGSQSHLPQSIFIPHTPFEKGEQTVFTSSLFKNSKKPRVFDQPTNRADLSFDIFSAAFALLARTEEYLSDVADQHQRFPAKANGWLAYGIQQVPLVDTWAWELLEVLQQKYPAFDWPAPSWHYQPSYDVDLPWKYLHRPVWRSIAASGRAVLKGEWSDLRERWSVLSGKKPDPFDVFDQLQDLHQGARQRPLFFIPVGNYGPFDKNIQPHRTAYRKLIRRLATFGTIGLHPSYRSFSQPQLLQEEKDRLEQIIGSPVTSSRQHYLRFRMPQTYQNLLEAGITDEYSMGFAETVGFRAGTAYPYPWYDLENESTTSLMIHPFAIMDVSLHTYGQIPPAQALHTMQELMRTLQSTGGDLITIWHNNSLSGQSPWENWDRLYFQWLDWIQHQGPSSPD